jgi:glycosyltransferase involved in cell wall biosynthesis
MKILHIIDSGGLYGAEIVLLNLIAEQIKLGLDPTLGSIGEKRIEEKAIEAEAIKRGFKVKKFQMRPGPNIVGAWKILQFAHKEGIDVMHCHGYKGNIFFGFIPKRIRKIPLVSTLHGWTNTNGLTKMLFYEWLDSKSLKFIDAVVLVSEAMKSNPKLKNRKGLNLHVVPNGISLFDKQKGFDNSINATSDSLKIDQSFINFCKKGFTIGSIGRLSREKGYKHLIEALKLLVQQGIDARLVIIGEGSERANLKGLVGRYKLSDRIMMPGYRESAKDYIPLFNVFVIPSLTEGLPMTLLEAMQVKVPIVATKVGGIPEVLGHGRAGILIQPSNPKVLAEGISRLYYDEKYGSKLSNFAYQRVIRNYSGKAMVFKYNDIYQKLVKAR